MRPTRSPQVLAQAQDLWSELSDSDDIELMLSQIEEYLQQHPDVQDNLHFEFDNEPPDDH